ncbi:MAG: hypothetical protein MJY87_02425 [Fibrobacter sp.]|nr:hypothetical protein [Fibrobacter sp.]
MNAIDKRNADRESVAAEERARQEEASEYQRRFAERFNDGMKKTLSEDQQKRVVGIVNDEDSAINVALSSKGGEVLQNWLMTDCENPADVILYLEDNAQKMDLLLKLSPRKQVAQLDILERHLARSRYEASRKGKNGGADDQNRQQARKVPVMGLFGGSTQAVGDTSQLSDTKRVAKLIKAMRKR